MKTLVCVRGRCEHLNVQHFESVLILEFDIG